MLSSVLSIEWSGRARMSESIFGKSLVGTYWNKSRGRSTVVAGKNTHLRLRNGGISGPGRLLLGCQWEDGLHRASQFVVRKNARVSVSGSFRIFEASMVWVNEGATLDLGSGYVNSGLTMSVFQSVKIGSNVAIAENVTIRDSDNHRICDRTPGPQPISIGDYVWIGMNAIILKGVTIGDGAVVAAGAVVNRDVPPGMLVAGVPAKLIRPVRWE